MHAHIVNRALQHAPPAGVLAQQAAKPKVIFQVSDADPAKWNLALNNARNVQAELGKENVQIGDRRLRAGPTSGPSPS